jgi:UDP-glucose 4-epimerase
MIVAITGSSGFIGKKLVYSLLASNHEIIKLDKTEGINILDWDTIKKVKKFDVLVHLAALSFVPHSYEKPRDFYHLNINGVINGLELCRIFDAKFIFTSSYVYGKPKYIPIDEKHPLSGFNPYAETKIIGEKICENYFQHFKVRTTILRPFNIYGPMQNENFLIPKIIAQARTGVVKLQDPRPKRDFVYIDDVVEAFIMAVENKRVVFDRFNIGTGNSYSVEQVANIINTFYDKKLKIEFSINKRNNEVIETVANINKAIKILGWRPKTNLKSGLKVILDKELSESVK